MQRFSGSLAIAAAVLLAFAQTSMAQSMAHTGSALVPQSSIEHPGGHAHTNLMFEVIHGSPGQGLLKPNQTVGDPPFVGYGYETPASLGCIYRLVPTIIPGCNPNVVTQPPTGGSQTIAVVDAYDYPIASITDAFNAYSVQFGLVQAAAANFRVIYASGSEPAQDPTGDWEGEEALDVEMAHAMAPNADIILVEAASDSNSDLYTAVGVAETAVAAAGGGEVLMDWGESEYDFVDGADETSYDTYFTTEAPPGVVFISSTGDDPGTEYPSVSPYVVAVGGTALRRNPFTADLLGQVAWQDAGGGPSIYEPRPSYQNAVKSAFPAGTGARNARGVPDLAFDSDPNSGTWVYDNIPMTDLPGGGVSGSNWYIFGGTSLGAAAVAGIINSSGSFSPSSTRELTRIYNHMTVTTDFHDISSGSCGPYDGFSAALGWDYCTGVGIPRGYVGK